MKLHISQGYFLLYFPLQIHHCQRNILRFVPSPLHPAGTPQRFNAGATIFAEGDASDRMYIVHSSSVYFSSNQLRLRRYM